MTLVFQESLLGIYIANSHPYHLFTFNNTYSERFIVPIIPPFLPPPILGLLLGINCHLIKCFPQIRAWAQCSAHTCTLKVFIFAWINGWYLSWFWVLGPQALSFKQWFSVLTSSAAKLGASWFSLHVQESVLQCSSLEGLSLTIDFKHVTNTSLQECSYFNPAWDSGSLLLIHLFLSRT